MSLVVKICGLRSEAEVSVAVDAGANAIGFVFAESLRQVTPDEAAAASRRLPDGIVRVAVMRHPTNDEWQAVLETFEPDVLQTDAEDFELLDVPEFVRRWPVIREGADGELPDIFLYEGRDSGRGETVDWQQAAKVAQRGRMILAGGLDPDNVAEAVRIVKPYGVDVSSGVEMLPGRKDPALIQEFIRAARAAENTA